ncbi:hypothetical protein [Nitrospira sp. M1]
MGLLKKSASGVLAILPCSRITSTLRASKWLWPCWTDFFEPTRGFWHPTRARGILQLDISITQHSHNRKSPKLLLAKDSAKDVFFHSIYGIQPLTGTFFKKIPDPYNYGLGHRLFHQEGISI